ncbi:hypothetical protein PMAYCL1PPCAC_09390 [Pristionchus mayeri]|uniref:Uncharacterized protein n=1 Tax=Pristionchus mayeri TaxID=1317129 RepID=A0AAN4ZLJ2_9BILA|nr:hypothetical protein PMAYCL1PPCAC_09390 [Pristionchus mayeri]
MQNMYPVLGAIKPTTIELMPDAAVSIFQSDDGTFYYWKCDAVPELIYVISNGKKFMLTLRYRLFIE